MDALSPGGVVLCYHRVAESGPGRDPWKLRVSPDNFAEHLEVIRRHGQPMPLSKLTDMMADGKPTKGAVTISFDDGYADNYDTARPLLEKSGIPATYFVSSGAIKSERDFWWDELTALLLHPGCLPDLLELTIGDERHHLNLGDAIRYSEKDIVRDAGINVWEATPGTRLHFYHRLWSLLMPLDSSKQALVLDEIKDWIGQKGTQLATQKRMTHQQLREISDDGLIDIGGHTVNHASLPNSDDTRQAIEIESDKQTLESITESRVTSFAYPYGNHNSATVQRVKSAGYKRACSTIAGHNRCGANQYLLRRMTVWDYDGEELSRKLFGWARA